MPWSHLELFWELLPEHFQKNFPLKQNINKIFLVSENVSTFANVSAKVPEKVPSGTGALRESASVIVSKNVSNLVPSEICI